MSHVPFVWCQVVPLKDTEFTPRNGCNANQIIASFNYFSDMYIPAHFRNENEAELLDFIRKNSFGIIISNGLEFPLATHLPFTVEKTSAITLTSHFAAANPHANTLKSGDKVTVIFNGPHAYISPSHYDAAESVPTWNYLAIHVHGVYNVLADEEKDAVLRKMISAYEPEYEKQYDALSSKYLEGMMKGIVAFTISVSELQGKYKLSQNKNEEERKRIVEQLEKDAASIGLAEYMRNK